MSVNNFMNRTIASQDISRAFDKLAKGISQTISSYGISERVYAIIKTFLSGNSVVVVGNGTPYYFHEAKTFSFPQHSNCTEDFPSSQLISQELLIYGKDSHVEGFMNPIIVTSVNQGLIHFILIIHFL